MNSANVLYISYDGMTDPLGQSQVLPYLVGLSALGHSITILSSEKPDRMNREGAAVRRICSKASIDWQPLRYHARPPVLSTVADLRALRNAAFRLHRDKSFDLTHCRSYIPALVGDSLKRDRGVPLLFDMRGFWADEKKEGGSWDLRNPLFRMIYSYFKRRESELLDSADHVVSLTQAAEQVIRLEMQEPEASAPVSVIPCCVDLDHFDPESRDARSAGRARLGIAEDRPVLAYLGSLGGNYMLGEMLDFFLEYRKRLSGALFLFITRHPPGEIADAAAVRGISGEELIVREAGREEVPLFIGAADHGVAFKQPSFSAKACSPTKLGEMLAMGVPVVANSGVGDVEEIIRSGRAGVTIDQFVPASYRAAVDALLLADRSRSQLRESAREWFDLEAGISRYDAIYRQMCGNQPTTERMTRANFAAPTSAE